MSLRSLSIISILCALGCGEAPFEHDGGPGFDSGPGFDGGPGFDSGPGFDGGPGFDAGPGFDGGPAPVDAGTDIPIVIDGGPPTFPPDGYCGETDGWAFCEDFDGQGADGPVPLATGSMFSHYLHGHGELHRIRCPSHDSCEPFVEGGTLSTNAEDEGFGIDVTRIAQPFDFRGREGRIHISGDLQSSGRMQRVIQLTPVATNSLPDVRTIFDYSLGDEPALTIAFQGQGPRALIPFSAKRWADGRLAEDIVPYGSLDVDPAAIHEIDYYITRTSMRIVVDGVEISTATFDDIGFDVAYVYFGQAAYNPRKIEPGVTPVPAWRDPCLWDNIAFDGPVLPLNFLTPAGSEDVMVRAFSSTSCTIGGTPALGPSDGFWGLYSTWRVRVPTGSGLTLDDVSCTSYAEPFPGDIVLLRDLEVVRP